MRLPIRMLGLVAGAFLMGSALAPVSAQQNQSGTDGQVALRSDGALYLISNGQRRWVATVAASDEEIDRIPEGEPIYVGLAPLGTSTQASTGSSGSGSSSTGTRTTGSGSSGSGSSSGSSGSSSRAEPTPTSSQDFDEDLPIKMDIEGDDRFEKGDSFSVVISTKPDAVCELVAEFPDEDDTAEDSKNADSKGKCRYTIEIPKKAGDGEGKITGTVRDGGKVNQAEVSFRVVKKK